MRRSPVVPPASFPIAVVGMALRVPGATSLERYWRNLAEGRDCLARPSAAALRASGVPQSILAHPDFVRALPILDDVESFDADFFGLSAREAELTDPAHRLFLECAWEALEGAGIVPGRRGPVTGVFGGSEGNYQQRVLGHLDDARREPALALPIRIGNTIDFLTTRVSHRLDLTGPSVGVMAACATSLVAVDLAMQSLRRGECEVALAGGATVMHPRLNGYVAGIEGMLSPSGRLRPFDADADGTIFGSGAGVVALRPLEDALAAGNPIHAVILGSACTNDGRPPGKESFVAPSLEGQVAAIERALAESAVSPASIGYVEAHGTGTRLGDPVEVAALTDVYRRATSRTGYCSLGSVKANVGHLRTAAGVASLIKACLALERRARPPLANFARPNPRVDFEASPFVVHADARDWPAGAEPRRAAVSSFGFGGANAHLVLEEHRPPARAASRRRIHLLPLSARTPAALARRVEELAVHVDRQPAPAADVEHTLLHGRAAWSHRACYLVDDERVDAAAFARHAPAARGLAPPVPATAVFLFPGQGAQRVGAGRELYAHEPVYRDVVDRCSRTLEPRLGLDLRALLGYGDTPAVEGAAEALRMTAHAQPALFVVAYASARLLMSWGVRPAALLGHSLGEIVAACLAGVFSLDDALAIVAARGRLMQACEPGAMAAVFAPAALIAERLPDELEIAAINAPSITVVSGPAAEIERFCAAAARDGVVTQRIDTSHAFHSRAMTPALDAFARTFEGVALHAPTLPVVSNATGRPLGAAEATDPRYWADHIRRPVNFSEGVRHVLSLPHPVFAELGPGTTLGDLVRRHDADARVFPLLAGARDAGREDRVARAALAGLWCAGVALARDEDGPDDARPAMLELPTYPFERRRHWIDDERAAGAHPDRVLHERGYADAPLAAPGPVDVSRPWFVVGAPGGIVSCVRDSLAAAGADVIVAEPAGDFARMGDASFRMRPASRPDWQALFAARAGQVPRVILATALAGRQGPRNDARAFEASLDGGLLALAALAQGAFDQGCVEGLEALVVVDHVVRLPGEAGPRCAAQAAVLGGSRVIPREIAGLGLRVVDVPPDPAPPERDTIARMLVDEAQASTAAPLVALRPGRRLEERLYALPEPPRSRPRLREGGVVLITGGTGGLGLLFAGALFDLCRARLALTALWTPPPEAEWAERATIDDRIGRALAAVLALRARGADVIIVTANVEDRESLAAAIDTVRTRFGGLHGVVHAAGVAGSALVVETTAASVRRVLGSKALGGLHLDQLLAGIPLDVYLPVSSLATQVPAVGQLDYAAANAVLDALAQNRADRGEGLACAIGWGPWQKVGIAVDHLRKLLDTGEARGAARAAAEPLDHPVLRSRSRTSGGWTYRGELHPGHWVVDDHRLDGRPILSGTTTIQLVKTAFERHAPAAGAIEMTDVVFHRPLFAAQRGTSIELRFAAAYDDERFELLSRALDSDEPWSVNASGHVRRDEMSAPEALLPPPPARWDAAPLAPAFGNEHMTGGPRWGWRRRELGHEGRIWSRIELPSEFDGDFATWDLHPAVLDAATQGARGTEIAVVPHTYDLIRVHAPLEREIFAANSMRRVGGAAVNDVVVTDAQGRVLVELEGLVLRSIAGSALAGPASGQKERRDVGADSPGQRVVVAEPGNLDSLRIESFEPPPPGPGEVLIEVRAAGLNFRDLLTALGQIPLPDGGAFVPGGEASGLVRAVGAGVSHVAVGDAVVAIARGALATHVIAPAHAVVAMPSNLDFERAAGLPIVFLTAVHALESVARLERGERVLIHAGAGGVGFAAIQVARALGAEVFATAGSDDKRALLRSLGLEHVFDSRSLAFVEGVRAATGGEGVDVVLNSLAGEFMAAGMSVLRSGGRFVEIGKRDLLADAKLGLAPFLRNLAFTAFDLGLMVDQRHRQLPAMFDALMDRFARGDLVPPPTSILPLERAAEGFRRMARAQHVGKIVFAVDAATARQGALVRAFEASYGEGVTVDWGLDVFRRVLGWTEAPSFVLAAGLSLEGPKSDARPRAMDDGARGRERLATVYRAPRTPVEQALVDLWERTLGFEPIGVDDDFIDLGGDSMEAIQVQHAIQRDFGLRIRNTDFLADPTIAALAARIAARDAPDDDAPTRMAVEASSP